jgi:hypothetical protein
MRSRNGSITERKEAMTEFFDPDALLADVRARSKAANEQVDRIRARAGMKPSSRRSRPHFTDGLTAEQIERDTASIYRIMAIWRRIGKTTPSPIRLPSGRTIVPKSSATDLPARREFAVTRPRKVRT